MPLGPFGRDPNPNTLMLPTSPDFWSGGRRRLGSRTRVSTRRLIVGGSSAIIGTRTQGGFHYGGLTDGCMCGAVRYESSTELIMSGNCYCRDCQRSRSTDRSQEAYNLTGELRYYETTADSGNKIGRRFLPSTVSRRFSLCRPRCRIWSLLRLAASTTRPVPPRREHLYLQCAAVGADVIRPAEPSQDARLISSERLPFARR
jgi:hypothetical protein